MYQDIYQYLQWLYSCIQAHENRIASLEQTIQQMSQELMQLKEKNAIHVDRIEYKFDQLKVETLEGTLNIGLNPNDLSAIEDFAVQNQSLGTPLAPEVQMKRSMKIEQAIYSYLDTHLPAVIAEAQDQLAIPPNDSYLDFIREDIVKQLPGRIDFYLKESSKNRSIDEKSSDEQIIELVKQEIKNGVITFLNNLPDNMKGMNPS